ncbi:serum paraoxonase/arylesterase family protein [Aureobasidium pullulans]|nr:serum paraoxonase/arylesterase family protein [Aureobasidium pullulans]
MPGLFTYASVVALAALSAYVYPPVRHELTVVGIGRAVPQSTIPSSSSSADYVRIEDTYHCEDLHHYTPANLLFAACEDRPTRFGWFPPLHNFEPPVDGTQGSFHVIDPETKKSIRLSFENFDKTFVTHGIDVIPDPKDKKAVYIFAVNHQPNPEFTASLREHIQKSNSRIEIFRYKIGSPTIKHIRTVADARIETPNDIFAVSPEEFYVTNDHAYREGLMRELETVAPVGWSTTLHITITDLAASSPSSGITINTALTGIKSNNGLGHVHGSEEVTVISAERGILYRTFPNTNKTLTVEETIHLDSTLDNPSYYTDPWATPSSNTSGYVLAGLARGIDLAGNANKPDAKDPPYVWLVREGKDGGDWEKKIIFADDGSKVRTASAAVIVGIDPKKEGGKKKGWLFVTGFMSENMVAVKIDL